MENMPANITHLSIDSLRPNTYNPNRQTDAEFTENVAEVRRLGRLPKPIVVRPDGDGRYIIVDGEHGWQAAKEAGLVEVPCEIIEADDFEAMRQTYKRNRSGADNKVLLGRMFDLMQAERGMSRRQLAKEIGVPESTIRFHSDYSNACKLREACSQDNCVEDIAELSTREVKAYIGLRDGLRDKWFDAGHELSDLSGLYQEDVGEFAINLEQSGYADIVEADCRRFRPSLDFVLELVEWRKAHKGIADVDAYLRPVAELRLGEENDFPPLKTLTQLPCRHVKDGIEVVLPAERWAAILRDAANRTSDAYGFLALVEKGVRVALKKASVDLDDVFGPDLAEALETIEAAPAFIRDADLLSTDEKAWLAAAESEVPSALLERAKQQTCEYLQRQRSKAGDVASDETGRLDAADSVNDVLNHFLEVLYGERERAAEDEVFSDPGRLIDELKQRLSDAQPLEGVLIGDRPAREVLIDRLKAIQAPEVALIAAAVFKADSVDEMATRWLAVITDSTIAE